MDSHLTTLLCLFAPALGILVGHWFPWRKAIGRDLSRLEAYAYGVAWIVTMPTLVMLAQGQWLYAALVVLAVLGAGGATIASYAIDGWIEMRHKQMDLQDRLNYAGIRDTNQAD